MLDVRALAQAWLILAHFGLEVVQDTLMFNFFIESARRIDLFEQRLALIDIGAVHSIKNARGSFVNAKLIKLNKELPNAEATTAGLTQPSNRVQGKSPIVKAASAPLL